MPLLFFYSIMRTIFFANRAGRNPGLGGDSCVVPGVNGRGLDRGRNRQMFPALPGRTWGCTGAVTNAKITAPVRSPLCPGSGGPGMPLIAAL